MKKHSMTLAIVPSMVLMFLIGFNTSCKKTSNKHQCYDEQLYQQSKDKFCTADCPGVKGCDGKTYCNACEAARNGIKVN